MTHSQFPTCVIHKFYYELIDSMNENSISLIGRLFFPENVFDMCYQIYTKVANDINYKETLKDDTDKNRVKFWKQYRDVENHIENTKELLKKFIGPWMCVFTGNFKSPKSQKTEAKIRKKVNEFLLRHTHFDEAQQKMIHLIARRTDLLTSESIFLAITRVLKDKPKLGYDDIDLNNLYDFITWIKQEFVYDDLSCYPCILIVDEWLDQLPFECINANQEITRISSFYLLQKLYFKYSDRIKNGYLMCSTDNANVLLNPDTTLSKMEARMKGFFSYWTPGWNQFCGIKPTKEQFKHWLTRSNIFVYCGHGSGVQYVSFDDLMKISINAVVFLFGCGSVALNSSGFFSELHGSHLYYQLRLVLLLLFHLP